MGDDVATPTSPVLDRAAPTAAHTSPVLDRAAPQAAAPGGADGGAATQRVPFLDRAAPHTTSPGGTHVLTSSGSDRFATTSGGGHGSAHGPGSHTLQEFRVALEELQHAITVVNGHRAQVADLLAQIHTAFVAAHDSWQSPSATTFETTATWFADCSQALKDLLDEMARRMRTTYDTYHAAETANAHNSGG
ncbi:WXG100 family type VII secretion target [Actinacidiphila rubida]|uniref:WXG100 family type VII secretion target n=1 Tax=Actinacidiphila rubida TaxID=310780 RepID=A0A1H8S0D6_9ACTN|nr:WXG100 family type VII secretion target [Actinacidiphila rubida]SEO71643.1 hypothetical protein SAMN05216267_103815 [Actinacidiphila rubida]